MTEIRQEIDVVPDQEQDPEAEAAARLARAQLLAHHVLSLRRVRADLTLAGGIGPETALRLLETQQFLTGDLAGLGHLALLDETQTEERLEGRKSLRL